MVDRLSLGRRPRGRARLTTPLHPDDYLRWSTRCGPRASCAAGSRRSIPETEDAATIVIRPGWGWRYDHKPGQYVGIGVQVDGQVPLALLLRELAAARATAAPSRSPCGRCPRASSPPTWSRASSRARSSGSRCPSGDFVLPDPPPARMLFLVGGSGITPVMAMLRTLDRRGTMPDVVVHYTSPTEERMIFRDELGELERPARGPHPAPAAHRPRRHARRWPTSTRSAPTGASARPGPAARRRCSTPSRSTGRTPGSRTRCTSSASPSSSAGTAARAARSPSRTPARPSRPTARPPCWRPGRRPASACPTAAGWASATPAR